MKCQAEVAGAGPGITHIVARNKGKRMEVSVDGEEVGSVDTPAKIN
jgi:hypothetical protein